MVAATAHAASWMLARLERDTHEHHAAAEANQFAVLDDPTVAGYRRFLATVYRFEHAVESRLVPVVDLNVRFLATRMRADRLADDLVALGRDVGVLEVYSRPLEVPRLPTRTEALGWIYVVQRNTLHHATLYRALAPRLRTSLGRASRYLTAYSNHLYARWHELGAQLDHAAAGGMADALVAAAQTAFAHQYRWYAACAPASRSRSLSGSARAATLR